MIYSPLMGTPQTEVYSGSKDSSHFARGIKECQELWNIENAFRVGTFDDLVVRQLDNALLREQSAITIVDLGSGSGGIFQHFIQELENIQNGTPKTKTQVPKTSDFLQTHPDIQIHLIGLTDALTSDEFNTHDRDYSNDNNPQVTFENISYSLTREQSYAQFLRDHSITEVNLTLATFSLPYFHPFLFQKTIREVIDSLTEGGMFIAAPFHTKLHHDQSAYTRRSPSHHKIGAIDMLERLFAAGITTQDTTTITEAHQLYSTLAARYTKILGFDAQAEILKISEDFTSTAEIIVGIACLQTFLELKKARIISDHKRETLLEMISTHPDQIESKISNYTIMMTKTSPVPRVDASLI